MSLMQTYKSFLTLKQSGRKAEARLIAMEVVRKYRDEPNPEFVYEICEQCDHKIDFMIWNGVVLPVLAEGLESNPRAVRGMIRTIQNLYSSKSDWEALGYVTEEQLTARLLKLCPGDVWAQDKRIEQLRDWLSYTIHEWPSGVLYGTDGASIEKCAEILDAVEELQSLDSAGNHAELCDDVRQKTIQYRSRLASNA
ncbi:MAG: hypothetical protein KDA87_24885 [Planctomycetales bacterium]|nr:hypothetical protein [Planctomycetales bacterium]